MKKYPGQKKINGLYHKIINQVPEHSIYYELCAGLAEIAKLLHPPGSTVRVVLNDPNSSITDKYDFSGSQNVTIKNELANYLLVTELSGAGTDTFVFIDPPYHHDTRPNNTELYTYEMTHDDHVQILRSVLQLKCKCMIIHPKHQLYDTMLSEWRKVPVKVRYHNKTSLECLYMNYDLPQVLHTDRYLGTDCWDRQRIKRKSERFVKKFSQLPELERKYILTRLQRFN